MEQSLTLEHLEKTAGAVHAYTLLIVTCCTVFLPSHFGNVQSVSQFLVCSIPWCITVAQHLLFSW